MTLTSAILKKAKTKTVRRKKYSSPPPEIEESASQDKVKRLIDKYAHVKSRVDTSPPAYDATRMGLNLPDWRNNVLAIYQDNIELLIAIKKVHFSRGKVDCRWTRMPAPCPLYYKRRSDFYKRVNFENKILYERILNANARVVPTSVLRRDWAFNRQDILNRAQAPFVLFPPVLTQQLEDGAFATPPGVKRPRVHLTLRIRDCAVLGELYAELFSDVCPKTCQLFLELLGGDGLGHGYVGTCFYRKVPGMYWSGGDVIHDNGCGCYAQAGRHMPIGAENFHFSHSMPGLLSMHVTRDDEMCGTFGITFKPLPQFDLRSVVFGRIIRPSNTFTAMQHFGSPLSVQPIVQIAAARYRVDKAWIQGVPHAKHGKKKERLILE